MSPRGKKEEGEKEEGEGERETAILIFFSSSFSSRSCCAIGRRGAEGWLLFCLEEERETLAKFCLCH